MAQEPLEETVSNQEFRLFEEVAQPESEADNGSSRRTAADRASSSRTTNSEPEFTLVGTSRIGNRRSVMLEHKSGNRVSVPIVEETNSQIPGYLNHRIVAFDNGEVNVRLPEDEPCIEDESKGVRCSGAMNISQLSLASRSPVPSNSPVRSPGNNANGAGNPAEATADGQAEGSGSDEAAPLTNPFEQMRQARAARQAGQEEGSGNINTRFTPRRIAPEDVPPGMRVVSTPFGDRLVPANN